MSLSGITAAKALINTLVRLSPIGLYSGSVLSAFIFGDFRATILFVGLMVNEGIALGYRLILRGIYNPQCALLSNVDDYFVLPSPITQTIGFVCGFFLAKMFDEGEFLPIRFFTMLFILAMVVFSRINIGCKGFLDAIYCAILGLILGVGYFNIVKDYYRPNFYKLESIEKDFDDFFKVDE
jgi:hypothetical protein